MTHSAKLDFFIKKETPEQMKIASAPQTGEWKLSAPQARYETNARGGEKRAIKVYNDSIGLSEKMKNAAVKTTADKEKSELIETPAAPPQSEEPPDFTVVGEAFNTYIIVQIKNDLYYIDVAFAPCGKAIAGGTRRYNRQSSPVI